MEHLPLQTADPVGRDLSLSYSCCELRRHGPPPKACTLFPLHGRLPQTLSGLHGTAPGTQEAHDVYHVERGRPWRQARVNSQGETKYC